MPSPIIIFNRDIITKTNVRTHEPIEEAFYISSSLLQKVVRSLRGCDRMDNVGISDGGTDMDEKKKKSKPNLRG